MYANNRINLLSDSEISAIYVLPSFNEVEQSLYFEFTASEIDIAKKYRTIKAQIHFMLSLGYFKAKQQFYQLNLKLYQDTQYILKKYFDKNNYCLSGEVDDKTYHKQKHDILTLFKYQDWSPKFEPQVGVPSRKPLHGSQQLID